MQAVIDYNDVGLARVTPSSSSSKELPSSSCSIPSSSSSSSSSLSPFIHTPIWSNLFDVPSSSPLLKESSSLLSMISESEVPIYYHRSSPSSCQYESRESPSYHSEPTSQGIESAQSPSALPSISSFPSLSVPMCTPFDLIPVKTGTTITACIFDKGVMLGADSRTSAGSYVVNRAARKISCLHDRVCVCRSGSSADTQTLTNIVKFSVQQYTHELPPKSLPRVRAVAQLFRRLCYDYKDHISAGLIVAGIDNEEGAQIYSIPVGGAVFPMKYASGGSGSIFISAYMDDNWKEGMTKEEAKQFISKSVAYAMSRDGSSGGLIRMVAIENDQVEEFCIWGKDLPVQSS